jgi:mono/diheme cytochrome c family protein
MRRFSLFMFFAVLTACLGYAQKKSVDIKVDQTSADNGKQMFANYCAPCHGVDGRGQGPVASALQTKPTDLTMLSRNHNGEFPENHLVSVLRFGVETPAHGSKQMPVWGPVLHKLDRSIGSQRTETLRIFNLVAYMKTLQQ